MKIIIINGEGGSGKTSFVNFIKSKSYLTNYFIYNFSTVDRIKTIAEQCGWDGEKDEAGRQLLSDLKDAFTKYNNLPYNDIVYKINLTLYKYRQFEIPTKNVVFFVHSREPEEIQKFKKELNAKSLLIRRPGITHFHNHADRFVYNCNYEYKYLNDKDYLGMQKDAEIFIDKLIEEDWYSYGKDLEEPWDQSSY